MELFKQTAGVDLVHVPYTGSAGAVRDLVGGHVDFLCEQSVSVAEQIKAGAVRGYVVSGNQRLAALPDIPSAKEVGINYQMSIWAGIFAPGGTPKPVVDKLAGALDKTLDDPAVAAKLADLGGTIPPKSERTPEKFGSFVRAEIARWSPILKAANVEAK